jgi:hypothetical protein
VGNDSEKATRSGSCLTCVNMYLPMDVDGGVSSMC